MLNQRQIAEAAQRIAPTITVAEVLAEMDRMKKELPNMDDMARHGLTFAAVRGSLAAVRAVEEDKQRSAARDAKIDGEPEIKALRRKLDDAIKRQDQVKAQGRSVLDGVGEVMGDLGADIARLEAEAEALAIEEALAGDFEFKRAAAKLKTIEPLRHRLGAATMARKKLGVNDDTMLQRMSDAVSVAQAALNEAIVRRKRGESLTPAISTQDEAPSREYMEALHRNARTSNDD